VSDPMKTSPAWGMQLPVQSQSSIYVQPWESLAGPDELALVAVAADRAGAGYVAVCDHVAIPDELVSAMGATWYDTVATLAWLAAQTERVRLLSHVWVLAYRHPAQTAKAFGTLDRLAPGRIVLGVGAGHVESEFELIGADFGARGAATTEAIVALRSTWSTGEINGPSGPFVVSPGPVTPGGPPIWVGGSSAPAIRRAVEHGDGWLPQGPPEGGVKRAVAAMRERRAELFADRPLEIGVHAGIFSNEPTDAPHVTLGDDAIAAQCRACVAIGGTQLQVRFISRSAEHLAEQVEWFGTEIWPQVVA